MTPIAITKINIPKYSCSTILNSELEKKTLSTKEERNLKIIPVPTKAIKDPMNLFGNLSSIYIFNLILNF